jgi:hypothetical protein
VQIQVQAVTFRKSRETLVKEREKEPRKERCEEERRQKGEGALFNPLQTQKVAFWVGPKTVLCQFLDAGRPEKDSKCKSSDDHRDVGRTVEKRNL